MYSSYYPPRAQDRWMPYGLTRPLDRWRLRAERLFFRPQSPDEPIPLGQWLLAIALPGYPFVLSQRPRFALLAMAAWSVALLIYLVFLPFSWATGWAIGVMASAHSTGLGSLWLRERERAAGGVRPGLLPAIGIPLGLWFGFLLFFYFPLSSTFQRHVALPVQSDNGPVVARPGVDSKSLRNGHPIALRMTSQFFQGGIRVEGGVTWGIYLAGPGSQVEFSMDAVRINGRPQARLPGMPTGGRIVIDQNTHLVWPRLQQHILTANPVALEPVYLSLAQVREENLVGRPLRRWFFWRQDFL